MEPRQTPEHVSTKDMIKSFLEQGFIPEENFKLMPCKKKKPKGFKKE